MSAFSTTFWTNFSNALSSNLTSAGISANAVNSILAMTTAPFTLVGGRFAMVAGQVRNIEQTAVTLAAGTGSAAENNQMTAFLLNSASALATGIAIVVTLNPPTIGGAIIVGLGTLVVSAVVGAFAQALYETISELYPSLASDAWDAAISAIEAAPQTVADAFEAMINGTVAGAESLFEMLADLWESFASAFTPNDMDPLVLDLDGDGIELTALENSNAHFDFGADGVAERTGWVAPDDGILVRDANNNGDVDGIHELFGSPTQDGFEELESLDINQDGKIDANDAAFAELRVWRDLDGDGEVDAGEMQALSAHGIASINLNRADVDETNNGHDIGYETSFTRTDGTQGTAQSVAWVPPTTFAAGHLQTVDSYGWGSG